MKSNRIYNILLITGLILVNPFYSFTQQRADSLFTIDDFTSLVIRNHPIVRQANLLDEIARQEIRFSRGFFDPKISSGFSAKKYEEKEYYELWDSKLQIPVWFNTDLKIGYERNTGEFVSDQLVTPSEGLWYAGISVPLGQGLIIDARRASLKQAMLIKNLNEAEKVKEINKVLLQAVKDYLNWYFAYYNLRFMDEGLDYALVRFEAIKRNVMQGTEAPLDSVEAKIIKQTREIERGQAMVEFRNAGLIASTHLWNEEEIPYEIKENIVPYFDVEWFEELKDQNLDTLKRKAIENHPELIKYQLKLKDLGIQRSLYREMIKPQLNFDYNFLWSGRMFPESGSVGGIFQDDYKYGLSFEMPLFLRKERSKLQLSNLKIQQTDYEYTQREREIINGIESVYNQVNNYTGLIDTQEAMVSNYEKLLSGEMLNFRNGQSSLFLVNTRETKLIESRIKLVDLQVKYYKSIIELLWAAGTPNLNLYPVGE